MTPFRPIAGLSEIAGDVDLLLCDVFGTLHDAEGAFPEALEALRRFRRGGGAVVLVSNAAEPGPLLAAGLAARGIAGIHDGLVSAGDVTRAALRERAGERGAVPILHIGPERDRVLFEGLDVETLDFEALDLAPASPEAPPIVCTGYPEDDADLDGALAAGCRRGAVMLCTNPDTSVVAGGRVLRFAGLVARRYRALGGPVIETGKPGPAIYAAALAEAARATGRTFRPARILGLGDTPALDAGGALAAGLSAALLMPAATASPDLPGPGRRYRLPALVW